MRRREDDNSWLRGAASRRTVHMPSSYRVPYRSTWAAIVCICVCVSVCLCLCLLVCVCVCVLCVVWCVFDYLCVLARARVCVLMYVYVHARMYVCVCMCVYASRQWTRFPQKSPIYNIRLLSRNIGLIYTYITYRTSYTIYHIIYQIWYMIYYIWHMIYLSRLSASLKYNIHHPHLCKKGLQQFMISLNSQVSFAKELYKK